jgi:hypothetical protein
MDEIETTYFRYTHTANVTGTSPGHYYESDKRYASGRYVRESDYAALLERNKKLVEAMKTVQQRTPLHNDYENETHDIIEAALAEEVDDGVNNGNA